MSDAKNDEAVFLVALEKATPQERAAYVEGACADDAGLLARVHELLKAHDQSQGPFDVPPPGIAVTSDDVSSPKGEVAGTVIGSYKLLEEIGEGGMGTVWMAQQTEPVKRLVAVKLIKAGMDSAQVVARFEAERQALALMDHPNIARVLDGGTTEAGRPYFVMDLVRGVPVTRYCDEHRLTPRQRLELFLPVCQAVQHAHQKGVIHRDLKPSNVLVALYDGKPVPKVIDFGVAKAGGQNLTDKTLVTGFGNIVGTLEYMSPEQAEINQLDIDTRSDIYSLGVLLYELLSGSTPFTRRELEKAGLLEMLRMIREQEPSKPSTKLSTADGLPTLAANRGTEPAKLTRLVRGELDWIVMKALEKDRNRRYETANGFAMDLQRYLADEPVLACPPSAGYRLKKFVRRNREPVVAVSLVLLALVVGIIGTTAGLVWAVRERDEKAQALTAEKEARDRAMTALRDLTDDFVQNQMARGPALTEEDKEFLRKVIKHYEGFAANTGDNVESRAIREEGYFRVGKIRSHLGELKEAEAAYAESLALQRQLTAEFPDQPEFRFHLALTRNNQGDLYKSTGRLAEAEAALLESLAVLERLTPEFHGVPEYRRGLAAAHNNLAGLREREGKREQAIAAQRRSLEILEKLAADFPRVAQYRMDVARAYHNLGRDYEFPGQYERAEANHRQALDILEKLLAEFPTAPAYRDGQGRCLDHLGGCLHRLGRYEKAEVALKRALEVREKLAAEFPAVPEYRQELADSHNNLGLLLGDRGRLPEADAAYRQALALYERLAAGFPTVTSYRRDLAQTHANLGVVLRYQGKLPEAESAHRRAAEIHEKLAAAHPDQPDLSHALAQTHNNLGLVLQHLGKVLDAEAAFRRAADIHEKLAATYPGQPDYLEDLGKHLQNLAILFGDGEKAIAAHRRALDVRSMLAHGFPSVPGYQQALAASHNEVGNLLFKQRKWEEAGIHYRQAITVLQKLVKEFPSEPRYLADLAENHGKLGLVLGRTGSRAEASAELKLAIDLMNNLVKERPNAPGFAVTLGGSLCNLGLTMMNAGRPADALDLYARAIETLTPVVVRQPRTPLAKQFLRNCHWNRAEAFSRLGRYAEAVSDFERAEDLDDGPDKVALRANLAMARLRRAQKDKEAAGCLSATAEYEALKPTDAGELYDAACNRAICAAVFGHDPKTPKADAARLAREQADLAMAWLRKAVAAGYKDAEHMKQDEDLDAMREREDFKKLLAELQAGKK